MARVRRGDEERRRVLGRVAHGERVEDDVVVVVLERRGRRQDQVRVPRRLVQVGIDRDHVLEAGQGAVETAAVGGRQHGVAGGRHERADLAGARRLDLLRQHGHRVLPAELGQAAHAAAALVEVPALPDAGGERDEVDRGPREHRATRTVEVAGDDVQHVQQPRREAAELLHRDADAAVRDRGLARGEVARDLPDDGGRDAGGALDALGRERCDERAHVVEPVGERGQRTRPHQPLGEQHVQQRQQEQRVRARADGHVQVRERRRLRPPRIDDHEPPAARLELLQPALDAGRRHQAAVRGERVRAEDEEVAGAVDVRHGQEELVPEHRERRQHLRELVHGRRRVAAARAQAAQQHLPEDRRAVVVHGRVALVDGDRLATVRLLDRGQALRRLVERRLPGDLLPVGAAPAQRPAQPIRVLVQVLERHRLGADVAAAERIVVVAPDREDAIALDADGDAAHRLAEVAGAEVREIGRSRHGC